MKKQLATTCLVLTLLLTGPNFAINSLRQLYPVSINIDAATINTLPSQTGIGAIFDTCIQDDSNGNSLQFNSTTGDYIFTTFSPNGFTLGGRAKVTTRGSIIILQQNGPDRRVQANIDNSVHRGTVAVQVFSLGRTFTIIDRNTTDSVCPPPQQTGVITPNGGTISIPGLATITFPAGAFLFDTSVNVSITQAAETQEDFDITTAILSADSRLPFEVRINSGSVASSTTFQVTVQVPGSFLSQLPNNAQLQVFAQIFEDGGEETLDSFELFPSSFDAVTKNIQVTLPAEAFTNRRTNNETFEAIIVIGTTLTKPLTGLVPTNENISQIEVAQSFSSNQSLAGQGTCEGPSLDPPLRGNLRVTSPFNKLGKHYGTDYAANTGDDVLAASDGKISKIGFDSRPLPKPDPRSGKLIKGYGNYVILAHVDGSHTLYAHLEMATVSKNQTVTSGTVIGKANNSGGSSASHLHLEYAPVGNILQTGNKVDPEPCVEVANPGCDNFLSFVGGNPGIAGDGIFVDSNASNNGFTLSSPISLGTVTDGITVTIFPPSPVNFQSVQLNIASINRPVPCNFLVGFSTSRTGGVLLNGVQGSFTNMLSPSVMSDLLNFLNLGAPGCNITQNDLYIVSIQIHPVGAITRLDAASICLGQNNFSGIRIQ
jgi:hypothetical protein